MYIIDSSDEDRFDEIGEVLSLCCIFFMAIYCHYYVLLKPVIYW